MSSGGPVRVYTRYRSSPCSGKCTVHLRLFQANLDIKPIMACTKLADLLATYCSEVHNKMGDTDCDVKLHQATAGEEFQTVE